jgi:hypothetical protein
MRRHKYHRRFSQLLSFVILTVLFLINVSPASAVGTIVFDGSPGTAAPPATLGPYTMTRFASDPRPEEFVMNVRAPHDLLTFSQSLLHTRVGSLWATWSHGYTGDVYHSAESADPNRLVMTLPANTVAFYFYAEPNAFSTFNIIATANDGTSSGPIPTEGFAGARYFGFYARDGATLRTITLNVDPNAQGFAVGEFGIAQLRYTARFKQPLDPSTSAKTVLNRVKNGRVLPVKLEIFSGDTEQKPSNVPATPTIKVSGHACNGMAAINPTKPYADAGRSSRGTNQFRWSEDFWIYNLDTKALGLIDGHCYRIDVYIGTALVSSPASQWVIIKVAG